MNRHLTLSLTPTWRALGSKSALVVALMMIACAAPPPEPPPPPETTYDTRGIVRKLPPGEAGGDILIAHEAIPSFADPDGKIVGMPAMSMPFHVADHGSLADVAVGDRVTLRFGVRWSNGPPLEILAIEPLDPDVRLDFEKQETETSVGPDSE